MMPRPDPSSADAVLEHVRARQDIIVPLANGEPVALLDAVEANATSLSGVRVHQMHALRDRRYLHGEFGDHLRHVSYFLSPVTRERFAEGTIDLVPNHFSQVPELLRRNCHDPLVLCTVSPPDRHGYFSLGTNADYTASFIGRARFFVEANPAMPRTLGRNQIHMSQVVGWTYHEAPMVEIEAATPSEPSGSMRTDSSIQNSFSSQTSPGFASHVQRTFLPIRSIATRRTGWRKPSHWPGCVSWLIRSCRSPACPIGST